MRATVIYGAGDVRVENVPDAALREPTDARRAAPASPLTTRSSTIYKGPRRTPATRRGVSL
jgi:hypothetical protein